MIKNYILLSVLFLISILPSSAQDLDATLLELNFQAHGNPDNYTRAENGFYFVAHLDYMDPIELWFSQGTPETTSLVMGFETTPAYISLENLRMIGNTLFFVVRGNELWTSEGTTQSTKHIKTFSSQVDNSVKVRDFIEYKGVAYFTADNGLGAELWMSDGTAGGTKPVKDINPGTAGSSPYSYFVFQEKLFFIANDGVRGRELWYSDGTPEGTSLFMDINPTAGAFGENSKFIYFNNEFYFNANDGIHGFEIWKSNGTVAGTALLKDTDPSSYSWSSPLEGIVIGNSLIFKAHKSTGNNLWKTDGTTNGTIKINDIAPQNFVSIGNTAYFLGGENFSWDTEVWKTDGTAAGTSKITSFLQTGGELQRGSLTSINNRLYFSAGSSLKNNMWTSDGTSAGTFKLGDTEINNSSSTEPENTYFGYNGRIYFTAQDLKNGREVYVSNGTPGSITLFKDVNRRSGTRPINLTDVNGQLYFAGQQGAYQGYQLFKSLGSPATTTMAADVYIYNNDIWKMQAFNNRVAFLAGDSQHGIELWLSNGTEHGTYMLKDIRPGTGSSFEYHYSEQLFYQIGDVMYFKANDGTHGIELWKSDGTESGTMMIKDIYTGSGHSEPSNIVSLNGSIYFSARDQDGTGLFKTDGTASGTQKVRNLNDLREIRVVNGKLLLIAETSGTTYGPHDLWVSDGTEAGTKFLESFGDNIDSDIRHIAVLGREMFFVAKNKINATISVFKSDGTPEGTKLVFDAGNHPEFPDTDIDDIFTCGQYVYFGVKTQYANYLSPMAEIWRTDGTPGNTKKIATSETGFNSITAVTCLNEDIYYLDPSLPSTIFSVKKDAGTAVEHKLNIVNGESLTGTNEDFIENLAAAGDHLYFTARTKYTGTELYAIKPGGTSQGSLDDDNDGVANTSDMCPGTPAARKVDAQGCEIPEIQNNNYKIEITGETCFGLNNGKVTITAVQNLNYTLLFNGNRFDFTNTISRSGLIPGDYEMCIIIADYPNYKQCYTFRVQGAAQVTGSTRTVQNGAKAYEVVDMHGGTAPFIVAVNGKEIAQFGSSSFQIEVGNGDALSITSSNACEGVLEKKVLLESKVMAYPNPTRDKVFINIPGVELGLTRIRLYSASQQLISDNKYEPRDGGFEISLGNLPGGVYFVKIELQEQVNLKVIKL